MMAVAADIPLIDINDGDRAQVAQQLVNAAEEHGFIYIRNQGLDISAHHIEEAFRISKKLFDAPVEEKQQCSIRTDNRGWSCMHKEVLDPQNQRVGDYKEAFNFGEFIDSKAQQPLPRTIHTEEAQICAFKDSCDRLCIKILDLLGEGLGIGDFFSAAHATRQGESSAILRLLHYPAPETTSQSNEDVRAGAHSDYGSITLLFRLKGQAGLEIQNRDKSWAPVPVTPSGTEHDTSPPILINIGDLLEYWTNGLFRSTVHRVVFGTGGSEKSVAGESSATARYSIAYFCHPAGSTVIGPVPSMRVTNFVPLGLTSNPLAEKKTVTADEHLQSRLKATYGDLYDKKP